MEERLNQESYNRKMTKYYEVNEKDKSDWDQVVTHPLQSWAWGEFRGKRQPISRIGKYEEGKLVKAFLVVWTKVPFSSLYFGYIPMGVVPDIEDVEALKIEAEKRNGIAIRMEPNEQKDSRNKMPGTMVRGRNLFKPKTFLWDLNLAEEELLKRMHPKARYNIKVATKHGVSVKEDNQSLGEYMKLLFEGTVKRQKVGMHDENYHKQMKESLGENARLFTASFANEIVSAMMVFIFKNSAYYAYGANSLKHKEIMASTLLVWDVAKTLKQEGFAYFDFWGAETGSGFSRFKEQFGAGLVETMGTYDLVVRKIGYAFFRLAEEMRWKIRHFK